MNAYCIRLWALVFSLFWFHQSLSAQCLQLQTCPAAPLEVCDLTENSADLWNAPYWWSPFYQTTNLPEEQVDLCFTVTDTCQGADLDIRYVLFLDMDGFGDPETVVSSDSLPGFNTVYFDNVGNPNYSGGDPRAFDQRPVAATEKYGFALEQTGTPDNRTACVRWNTETNPGTFLPPQLPHGTHRIEWIVSNGLGDVDTCAYEFTVKDCKAPTVVCLTGLIVNIMPTGSITLWAPDFLQYTEDNATPSNLLQTAIRRPGAGSGFPADTAGNPVTSVTFHCNDLGAQFVELWSRDQSGNADFCVVSAEIQDEHNFCGSWGLADVRVCVRNWCDGTIMPNPVDFSLQPGNIPANHYFSFDSLGCWVSDSVALIGDILTVTPVLDTDPLNGLDVLDLVAINKHILGLEPLPNGMAMIAADVNNSRSITTFDIIGIRRLLTGADLNFANNTSWRFVDGDYIFPNPSNPFQAAFPETQQINAVNNTLEGEFNFWAIKVGDVNCTAFPGLAPPSETRSTTCLNLPDRALQPGEIAEIPVRFAEAGSWLGFQLGLQYDPALLVVEAVLPGNLPNWDEYTAAQPQPGILNMLWFDTKPWRSNPDVPAFSLRLRALAPVSLRTALGAASGLRAEAFTVAEERRKIEFRFMETPVSDVRVGEAQPNPTAGGAIVPLQLEAPTLVRVAVWDSQGRRVWEQNTSFEAGFQQLSLPAKAFPTVGAYVWRISTGESVKTGRIVKSN